MKIIILFYTLIITMLCYCTWFCFKNNINNIFYYCLISLGCCGYFYLRIIEVISNIK